MSKVYDFKSANEVIAEAWGKAIEHSEQTLGDQYKCNVTENAMVKFWDYVQQDIEYKMECPVCGQVDIEGNFSRSIFEPSVDICYDCYLEEESK